MNLSRLVVVPPPKVSTSITAVAVEDEDERAERLKFADENGNSFWASIIDVDEVPYLTDVFALEENKTAISGIWYRVPKERYFKPNRVRRARELAGLSIARAARVACLERDLLASAENGNLNGLFSPGASLSATVYTQTRLRLLAKLYDVSPEWLQGRDRLLDSAMLDLLAILPTPDREAIRELLLMKD